MGEPVEELEDFELGDSKKKVRVGAQLPSEIKEALVAFLRKKQRCVRMEPRGHVGNTPIRNSPQAHG